RIPEGHPLSDPRKEAITAEHLLTMTSGIPGENAGVVGMPMATHLGSFEHALGFAPNRYGRWAKTLAGDPGSVWDYSDPAVAHLGLLFAQVAGRELADFFRERVGDPIGLESLAWDVQGGGGFLGPHTNAHTGVHLSARELVRFGYLLLRGGRWGARQLLQRWWIELATRTSQDLRPVYGYLWWVNSTGRQWPGLPTDAFAASGYRSNRCYVIPSLDLVVARVGSGPPTWDEPELIEGVVGAVVDTKAAESVPLVPDPGYSPVRQRAGHAERDVRVVPRT
ncbi:MAG: serine hydrolase domain-containing protein, partial [Candidatus Limnocylindria bacterium]